MGDRKIKGSEMRPADVFGIIGNPIGHTLSPLIHEQFGKWSRRSLSYVPFPVEGEELKTAVDGAHALGVKGLNVTVPHKSAVIPYLSDIDPMAERIGAVNTLVRTEGGYKGYNTDVTGLKRALVKAGVSLKGARVIILGAGGAGRAVTFLAASEGAAEVVVLNRTVERAAALAAEVADKTGNAHVRAEGTDAFLAALRDNSGDKKKYIAIQCTSVGLAPRTEESVVEDPAFFEALSFAVDIVYRPMITRFLRLAAEAGVPTLGGLSMLLYQAADAFALWYPDARLGDSDLLRVMGLLKARMLGSINLWLVGYMGSGKTTVAETLAKLLDLDVWDTDKMIEEGCGKSVSDIFADEGEAVFRRLETETLKKIEETMELSGTGHTGVIFSTGGGLPLAEENRRLLRESLWYTVYLRTRPETVVERLKGDETRPLLAGGDDAAKAKRVSEMLKERGPLYEDCADIIVDTDGKTPAQIAAEITARLAG